ncbi:MAG: RimK/LysX family protein [Candidatus Woesearchaeota archaeon]
MTDKTVVGLVEDVVVKGNNGKSRTLKARIDTGATKSSIDKEIVDELELGPVLRRRMTRQASGVTWRPVIKASIELAGRKFKFQFTIADRSEMTYKILIGQNILKRDFLIDPSK